MPFDYKKEYKEFYLPPQKPQLLEVPPMNYVAVRGHGDPNAQDGEYQAAIGILYAVAFTIKMSYKGTHRIPGYCGAAAGGPLVAGGAKPGRLRP